MYAIRYHAHGGPETLRYEEVPDPQPAKGEVLIRIEVAGVNYADTVRRYGDYYPLPTVFPAIPGGEIAGTVEDVGQGVDDFKIGDKVFAEINQGGYAQYAATAVENVIPVPEGLELKTGLALVIQGLTAAFILKRTACIEPGESILIQGAAGGVGVFSVQLAKVYGAGLVIAAAGSPQKRELTLGFGADAAVDYTDHGWPQEVRKLTSGRGVDIIQEMTGGKVFQQSLDCLAEFGRLVVYGFASREPVNLNPGRLLPPNHKVMGFYVGAYLKHEPTLVNATLDELAGLVKGGQLKVHIGGEFPLAEAAQAQRLLESRQTTGKLLIIPWGR